LIELGPNHTSILYQLLELHEVLKNNYEYLQKWGFHYEDRMDKIKYSLLDLKKDIRLMRKKIIEINSALDKLRWMLKKEENNMVNIQNIAKQLKLLELLIIYCQIVKIKIGKPSQVTERSIYKFASS
jgi:DNA-directed RNA polymerase subunit F